MNGGEDKFDLRKRTKQFALRIIRLCSSIGGGIEEVVIRRQLVRCGTSVGAQYREACRARSRAEFISEMELAAQELDESSYWMELLVEAHFVRDEVLSDLMREADELMAIIVASIRTSKRNDD